MHMPCSLRSDRTVGCGRSDHTMKRPPSHPQLQPQLELEPRGLPRVILVYTELPDYQVLVLVRPQGAMLNERKHIIILSEKSTVKN